MKVKDAMEIVDRGWVQKRKGFRVHFQRRAGSEITTDFVPGEKEKPLDSEVVAWRLAWKLSQATKPENPDIKEGDIVNIYVVDDSGDPVKYYATNQLDIFNQRDIEKA